MRRLTLVAACSGLLLAGCGGLEGEMPAAQPKPGANAEEKAGAEQPKTPIVRSLLGAIDRVESEDEEAKHELRRTLREADEELSRVPGKNSRRLIEEANKRAPAPTIGPAARQAIKAETP
ncbi:MAG: hypothetical protein ACYSWU_08240 [Planctomycetota bacterium]|jgi:hypothetical protein